MIVVTRREIFSLKFTKLGGRAPPGPRVQLKRSPRLPSRNKGAYF